jgi:hypothetical protein
MEDILIYSGIIDNNRPLSVSFLEKICASGTVAHKEAIFASQKFGWRKVRLPNHSSPIRKELNTLI